MYAGADSLMSISSRSMTSKTLPYVQHAGAGESGGEMHDKCLFHSFSVAFITILQ